MVRIALALFAGLLLACSSPQRGFLPPPDTPGSGGNLAPTSPRDIGRGYESHDLLVQLTRTGGYRLGRPRSIRVTPDGKAALFLRSDDTSPVQNLYETDLETGAERLVMLARSLLGGTEEKLTVEERARRERAREKARGIISFELAPDGNRVLIPVAGRLFILTRKDGAVRELTSDYGPAIDARLSPDGNAISAVRDGDLYVIDLATGQERRLTHRPQPEITHGVAELVAQEEMGRRRGYWWSPDSRFIAYQQTDSTGVEMLGIADPAHPERPVTRFAYPRAGRANVRVRLGIIPATGGKTAWVEWDDAGFAYLAGVTWSEKAPLTILLQNRRQTAQTLFAVALKSGRLHPLLTERDDAWVNLHQGIPRWLADGTGFLWITERSGAPQLELRAASGALLRPLTDTALGLRHFLGLDARGEHAFVTAASDPTEQHIYRVPLTGSAGAPFQLTTDRGWHDGNVDGNVVFRSSIDLSARRRFVAMRPDGHALVEIESPTSEPKQPFAVELTVVQANDEEIHAAIVRPRLFVRGKRYPTVLHVYGGPGSQMVTRRGDRYAFSQWLADQGLIVVHADGRGTPNRGRDWERAIKGDVISKPLSDQVAALRALGKRYPEIDLDRLGIYGWSFGGYFSIMAMLLARDDFDAGFAVAPAADWTDYDTHYTERYLGLPQENLRGYAHCNAVLHASKLGGALMIAHGTADDNVYFTHTLKLSKALFDVGEPHRVLPLVGFTHMVPDPDALATLYRHIARFFRDELGDRAGDH